MIASLLMVPSLLALSIAELKSLRSLESPFLIPTPTPFPNAPPEKVGPVKTTDTAPIHRSAPKLTDL